MSDTAGTVLHEQHSKEKEDMATQDTAAVDNIITSDATIHVDIEKETVSTPWEEDGPISDHPLQTSTLDASAYNDGNPWAQQDSALLEDEEDNSHVDTPIIPTTTAEDVKPASGNTCHSKGFHNATDTSQIVDLTISGRLPDWLTGEVLTIGPGTYDIKYTRKVEIDGQLQSASALFTFGHWFDGLPLVNRYDFNGQRNSISYRNRLTSRRLIDKIRDHHGYAPSHPASLFKTNSNQTILAKFIRSGTKLNKPDAEPCAARILPNIPGLEGRLFAQNSSNHFQELDPFDLKPTRLLSWDQINPQFKGYSSCPNGRFDPKTKEYINFTMDIGYNSTRYNFFSLNEQNIKGSLVASVVAPPAFVNSFALTSNYIILTIFPMLVNSGAVKFTWNESILDSFSFSKTEPTLFYVISRETGQTISIYRSDPCFGLHHVNAFEDENNNVFVDIVCYPDDTILHQLTTESLRNPNNMNPPRLMPSEVRRYLLPSVEEEHATYLANSTSLSSASTVTSRISSMWSYIRKSEKETKNRAVDTNKWYAWMTVASYEKLVQPSLELPQINPYYHLRKYSYMYSLGFSASSSIRDGEIWDSIVKTDVQNKSIIASWHEEHCYPSEPLFIPRSPANSDEEVAEDEGVLVSVVMDAIRDTSFLLVLNASTLEVHARAELGQLIPISFAHGSYRLRQ
ncbi:carotenoid oxygenase [Radiomyces spectabilis]|uniref:carotenoid oxygenase n=1 Tax=Radiomyces spectabilis TaxID=64574 RepID=UPI0022207295|nr:carotenoid oxygenase [Radiomyces spectabilis]KAI8379059.1 carotenoid oxygenase [Radiomyces spectabilis]